MSNSSLVSYIKISPNKTSPRNHAIDTITIHCVVGQCSVETLGDIFAQTSRQASSNYGIGPDGRIGMYVEEKDRSWCSSSGSNDHRAITIEVASDTTEPYAVTDAAYEALIKLCADICKRNGIKKLLWKADKSLIGQVDKQNMTVHRWFANKSCPGEYLYSRHYDIANRVNAILGSSNKEKPVSSEQMYRVRKSWNDPKSQIGAFKVYDNAIKACKSGYSVYDKDGNCVYTKDAVDSKPSVDIEDLARRTIRGEFGNGQARKDALGSNYAAVQKRVNEILS